MLKFVRLFANFLLSNQMAMVGGVPLYIGFNGKTPGFLVRSISYKTVLN